MSRFTDEEGIMVEALTALAIPVVRDPKRWEMWRGILLEILPRLHRQVREGTPTWPLLQRLEDVLACHGDITARVLPRLQNDLVRFHEERAALLLDRTRRDRGY